MKNRNSTRDRILNTATSLFQTKGFHATGLNEILKKSDAPKGSLYYYFPEGKEQLALEAVNLTKDFVEERIKNKLAEIDDPVESITDYIVKMADGLYAPQEDIISFKSSKKVSINLIALETAMTNDKLRVACMNTFKSWQDIYTKKLIKGGFENEKAEEYGLLIESMIEGAILMSLTNKSDEPLLNVAKQIPTILK